MDKIDLFKSLMNKEFWNANKFRLDKELFSDVLEDLFESLIIAHDNNAGSVSCRDLYGIHYSNNPTLTTSNNAIIIDVIRQIHESEALSIESASYILNKALLELKATKIAKACLEIAQGKNEDWIKIEQLLKFDAIQEEIKLVSTDIEEITSEIAQGKYRYNLEELDRA